VEFPRSGLASPISFRPLIHSSAELPPTPVQSHPSGRGGPRSDLTSDFFPAAPSREARAARLLGPRQARRTRRHPRRQGPKSRRNRPAAGAGRPPARVSRAARPAAPPIRTGPRPTPSHTVGTREPASTELRAPERDPPVNPAGQLGRPDFHSAPRLGPTRNAFTPRVPRSRPHFRPPRSAPCFADKVLPLGPP